MHPAKESRRETRNEIGTRRHLRRVPRILVIDDENAIVMTIRAALQGKADVVTATNATDASRLLLEDGDFQTVLCDLELGPASGIDLHEAVEETDPALAERFVFMTGRADLFPSSLARAHNRWLRKPFGLQEVLTLLDGESEPSSLRRSVKTASLQSTS